MIAAIGLEMTVTVGNLITIGAGMTAWLLTVQKLKDKSETQAATIQKQGLMLDKLMEMGVMTTVEQQGRRLRDIELTLQSIQTFISGMQSDVTWLKRSVERGQPSGD